jgi:parvulin-like peptidyl-prolyl isomerase
MKTKIKLIFSATLAVLAATNLSAATSGEAPTNAAPVDPMTALFGDPVIAKGSGVEVKRSQLDEVIGAIKAKAMAQGQTISQDQLTQFKQMALSDLIATQLLLQRATDADKAKGQKEADDQIARILKQFGSQDALDRQLKASGKTMDELRAQAAKSGTTSAVLIRELNATPTDADLKKYYDAHPADFEQPETAHVSHILLLTVDPSTRTPLPDDQIKAKRKLIDDLLKRARAGEDFATLAKQYSEDPGSKENGGELPAFPRGQMVPEFEAAAFTMNTNTISDVVTTVYGYHIIKLIERKPAKKLDYASVSDNLKDYLTLQNLKQLAPPYVAKLKKAANVEILDADLKAAAAAADALPTPTPDAPASN